MSDLQICVLPGDGIGGEVMAAAQAALAALEGRFGFRLAAEEHPGGAAYWRETGREMPQGAWEAARAAELGVPLPKSSRCIARRQSDRSIAAGVKGRRPCNLWARPSRAGWRERSAAVSQTRRMRPLSDLSCPIENVTRDTSIRIGKTAG